MEVYLVTLTDACPVTQKYLNSSLQKLGCLLCQVFDYFVCHLMKMNIWLWTVCTCSHRITIVSLLTIWQWAPRVKHQPIFKSLQNRSSCAKKFLIWFWAKFFPDFFQSLVSSSFLCVSFHYCRGEIKQITLDSSLHWCTGILL